MNTLLLHTDIDSCFDSGGKRVPCPGAGHDAAFGVLDQSFRFRVDGPVVHDRLTGAIWLKDANPAGFPLSRAEAEDAAAAMAAEAQYGHSGWRLPTRSALFSLVSHKNINPCLPDGHPFANVFPGYYWTSDSCRRLPAQAWHIHFGGGRVVKADKTDASLFWPVCLAPAPGNKGPGSRFRVGNGVAVDARSGLCWSLDADPAKTMLRWDEALAFVRELNEKAWLGHADWRLPNVRELESLVDLEQDSPAIEQGHPFTGVAEGYWSSTSSMYETRYAWTLYMRDGMVGVGFKTGPEFHCWPVRG